MVSREYEKRGGGEGRGRKVWGKKKTCVDQDERKLRMGFGGRQGRSRANHTGSKRGGLGASYVRGGDGVKNFLEGGEKIKTKMRRRGDELVSRSRHGEMIALTTRAEFKRQREPTHKTGGEGGLWGGGVWVEGGRENGVGGGRKN